MIGWHPDPDCNAAIVRLLDALSSWEHATRHESLFVLIPVESEEPVIVADSGRPLGPAAYLTNEMICERVEQALTYHDDPHVHNFFG